MTPKIPQTPGITSKIDLVCNVLQNWQLEVPRHQRHYDWEKEHVGDLLKDLELIQNNTKACYFLGSIMFQERAGSQKGKAFILDGQQRLITISLLVSRLHYKFNSYGNRYRDRAKTAQRILYNLSCNSDERLSDMSNVELRITGAPLDNAKYRRIIENNDNQTAANDLLATAQNTIVEFVEKMSRADVKNLFDFLLGKVEISVLLIPDKFNVHSVFESINARGKQLNNVDLIRNYIYSYFSNTHSSPQYSKVHENLTHISNFFHTPTKIKEYYRGYLQCCYGYIKDHRLYRDAREPMQQAAKKARGASGASNYVHSFVSDFGNPDNLKLFHRISISKLNEFDDNTLPQIKDTRTTPVLLNELHTYGYSHPLVFALLYCFRAQSTSEKSKEIEQMIVRSLQNLTSFVLRNAFISAKTTPSRFDKIFSNCANRIFKIGQANKISSEEINSLCIYEDLKMVSKGKAMREISDEIFVQRVIERDFSDAPKARRLLFGVNAGMGTGSSAIMENECDLEHILPESPDHHEGWPAFTADKATMYCHRIGNLTVVTKDTNLSSSEYNRNFNEKRKIFANSLFKITQDVAKKRIWTPKAIDNRSKDLANAATKTWKFSYPKF